ncbi:RING finger protein 222 [Electrophorus electricus]|uniref:RING finger protein 222 n=1 Tax=Electrophorus electricus TaxID=8005 RepID=UPI0015CFE1A6|nr:RING finger protein 222 [Electrophorus electricus]
MDEEAQDSECPVCYESLQESPRTLSCGHVFCHDCLVRTFVSVNRDEIVTRDSIICPICRHVTFVTKQGLGGCSGKTEKNAKILEVPSPSNSRSLNVRLPWIGQCIPWVSSRRSRQRLVCPKESLQVFIISDLGRPMSEEDIIDVGANAGIQENSRTLRCALCTTSHCLLILLIAFTLLALVAATLPWVLLA